MVRTGVSDASSQGSPLTGASERFVVRNGKLCFGQRVLGPETALLCDDSEKTEGKGVIRLDMPHRVDYIFAAKDKVVGVESKTVQDLISSWLSRRLQRQLRTLRQTVDVPCLMLRGLDSWFDMSEYPDLQYDLLKWQLIDSEEYGHGPGLVLFGPEGSPVEALAETKAILRGAKNLRTVLAGTDKREYRGSPREAALQRALPHVGPVLAKRFAADIGNLLAVLQASDSQLTAAGANKRVLAARKEVLS